MKKNEISNLLAYTKIIEQQFKAAQKAKVWVAALTLGCSQIECLLLMRAISSIEQIRELPEHKNITAQVLCGPKWGLSQFCKLAHRLNWFDAKHMDKALAEMLIQVIRKEFPQIQQSSLNDAVPSLMLYLAKNQRNMIHPGKVAIMSVAPKHNAFIETAEGYCILLNKISSCFRETQNQAALG